MMNKTLHASCVEDTSCACHENHRCRSKAVHQLGPRDEMRLLRQRIRCTFFGVHMLSQAHVSYVLLAEQKTREQATLDTGTIFEKYIQKRSGKGIELCMEGLLTLSMECRIFCPWRKPCLPGNGSDIEICESQWRNSMGTAAIEIATGVLRWRKVIKGIFEVWGGLV
jgi:hypothetical protein